MTAGRPNIPESVKREVRQRCGFGCVICGLPLYEYDHLLGWAQVHRHVAEEITLLCDQHHREKTNGLLPEMQVVAASANPCNKRKGTSAPYAFHYAGAECSMKIGTSIVLARDGGHGLFMCGVSVDGQPLVAFRGEDQHLLLSILVLDRDNEPLMAVQDNEMMYSTSTWDVSLMGRNLIVREAAGEVALDVSFDVPHGVDIRRAHLRANGVDIEVSAGAVRINSEEYGITASNSLYVGGDVVSGISIGGRSPRLPGWLHIDRITRRYGQ